jgi:hypothetical protein
MGINTSALIYQRVGRNTKKLVAAVVSVVDENGSPPPELRLAWNCARWGTLPDDGGMYAQDAYLITRMNILANIYDTVNKLRNSQGKQIHSLTENERKTLRYLVDLGLLFNG